MTKKNRTVFISVIIVLAIAMLALFLMLFYSNTVKNTLNAEISSYLQEVTTQEAALIETKVTGDLSTLEGLATALSAPELRDASSEEVFDMLKDVQKQNGFKRMGFIDMDGNAVTSDGATADFSTRDYFHKAMRGIPNVSDTFHDAIDGEAEPINVYAVPIFNGNRIVSVLFATQATDEFEQKISVPTFDGNGYSYVVKRDGTSVARSHHPNSISFDNLFSFWEGKISDVHNTFPTMQKDMQEGKSGIAQYDKDGALYYIGYTPVDVNDWYLLSIVPASVIAAKSSYLVTLNSWVTFIIVATVAALLAYILVSQNRARKKIERIAFTDEVTGSFSWLKFRECCKDILRANPDQHFAFVSLDINKFKIFNQLYDYDNGNLLLRHVAAVLENDMHENEIFSHTGSDEFNVLITYYSQGDIVGRILKWNQAIREYEFTMKRNYNLLLSYGVYQVEPGDTYVTRMSDRSKIAKNSIKHNSHIFYAFYSDAMNAEMLREKQLENDMESALSGGEFLVYYQPKYDLNTEQPLAAEALVRWRSPNSGFMNPGVFIPVFEKNGFIVKLDMHVFEHVCIFLRNRLDEGKNVVPIAVNFSRLNMYRTDFVEQLLSIIQKYDISTDLLEIELTESALTYNDELIVARMHELKDAGFRLTIDDFGTGYSSLNLLRTLPVDVIKLDKRFFTQRLDSDREKIVISSIEDMAQKLEITVVAEGVETTAQADFLKKIGYDIVVQGFLYAHPMPEEEFVGLLDMLGKGPLKKDPDEGE